MRIGGGVPQANWVAMKMAQQVFVQAGAHASQPTAIPVSPAVRVETSPAPRPLTGGLLDVRV